MHLEFLVEERSAEVFLAELLPRILAGRATFKIHPHQGKPDLLRKLVNRLKGYRRSLPRDSGIVVLVDRDRRDCLAEKERLEEAAARAGLVSKTAAGPGRCFQVLNRLAIEELEAWFFGDVEAMKAAYPRLPETLAARKPYRDPDAIAGGTWEALERELQKAGYYGAGLAKVEAAGRISRCMDPQRNRSRSFQVFRDGVLAFVS